MLGQVINNQVHELNLRGLYRSTFVEERKLETIS
jgi:hypothetical protein